VLREISIRRALLALLLLPALLVPGGWRTCLCVCESVSFCVPERSDCAPSESCCAPTTPTAPEFAHLAHDCDGCRRIDVKPIDTARPGQGADSWSAELPMLFAQPAFARIEPLLASAREHARAAVLPTARRDRLRIPLRI
jgi:hypothetical protein